MTTENNKIIAEFMGEKLPYKNKQGNWEYNVKGAGLINSPNIEDLNRFLGFNYHSDWNWLMEVVEKIESLGYDVFINTCVCRITDVGQDVLEDIETFNYENKIQAVYNACVEFIKWYNENVANLENK